MSDCPDCTQARATRWHGGYRIGCLGCAARAVARSQAMHDAVTSRTQDAFRTLRETISNAIPGQPYEEAKAAVIEWWRNDHPERTA